VVITHNLAIGVIAGVVIAMVMFARRVAHFATVTRLVASVTRLVASEGETETVRYTVTGELFFASSNDIYTQFEYALDPSAVIIDMTQSHIWDASTVAALDSGMAKYEQYGKTVEFVGLNDASIAFQSRLSGKLGDETYS